jgi:hypothetical protein
MRRVSNHLRNKSRYYFIPFHIVSEDYKPQEYLYKEHHGETTYPDDLMICTSQPRADALAESLEGWTECYMTGRAKSWLTSQPGWPAPLPATPRPPICVVRDKPGRGKALFAVRHIARGELILAERPLILTTIAYGGGRPRNMEVNKEVLLQEILRDAEEELRPVFGRLSKAHQKAFMDLKDSHTEDGSGPILGRIRTNGFAADIGNETYSAVCNMLSRANHR